MDNNAQHCNGHIFHRKYGTAKHVKSHILPQKSLDNAKLMEFSLKTYQMFFSA